MERTGKAAARAAAGLLAGLLLLAGCGDAAPNGGGAEAGGGTKRPAVAYASLAPTSAVLVAGGVALTKAQLEDECEIQAVLAGLSRPRLTLDEAERLKANLRANATRRFVLRRAVLGEAARRGLSVSDGEFAAFRSNFVKRVCRSRPSWAGITNRLTAAQGAALEADLRLDCLYQKAHAALRDECREEVTEKEAQRRFRRVAAYNERARKAEREIHAEATNVWRRLEAGEAFEAACARLAGREPRVEAETEWGSFQMPFFDDEPAAAAALKALAPGGVTPPLAAFNGLAVLKLLEIVPLDDPKAPGGPRYRLGRIFFQLPETFELTDVAALRRRLADELSDEKLESALLRLQADLEIVHPNGYVAMPAVGAGRGRRDAAKK